MSNFKTNERSTEAVSRTLLGVMFWAMRIGFYYKTLTKLKKLAGIARYMSCLD